MQAVPGCCHEGTREVTLIPAVLEVIFLCRESFDQNVIVVVW